MSEIRQDPLSGRWVIIGGERAGRPNEFVEAATRQQDLPCPFCAGHEAETPPTIATFGSSKMRPWLVRVVPNKYPAVSVEGTLSVPLSADGTRSVPTTSAAFGRHEVIVESPDHVATISELDDCELDAVFSAYHARLQDLGRSGDFRYVQIFKNVGPGAGASLEHLHSQLIALPTVPEFLEQELAASGTYFQQHGRSLLVDTIKAELSTGQRVVAATNNFVAFCPFASRFAYEVWVAPRRHQARFEAADPGELSELSRLVRDVIGRIECAVGQVAYNYFLHTRPFDMPAYDHYHWHIEIIPRLTKVAGFEWSTGCFINPYPPESAAVHLRSSSPMLGRRGTS
jgi:UDPglucose--hexose-1-phosphate uridylyltransferase